MYQKPGDDVSTVSKTNLAEMTTLLVKHINEMKSNYEVHLGSQLEVL